MKSKVGKRKRVVMAILLAISIIATSLNFQHIVSNAQEDSINISGQFYELEKDSNYAFSGTTTNKVTNSNFGTLQINGNLEASDSVNGVNAYTISDGNITFNYSLGTKFINAGDEEWHLIDDNSKKVDTETLENQIKKGAILLQTSLDGASWITDVSFTNIAGDENYNSNFYTSKDIQQVNGCYYRIIVAYELETVTGTSNFAFISHDITENKKCVEVYEFYLINSIDNISNGTSPSATPRKELGDVINAGKDTGFSEINALENSDPNYGWSIGTFFVNGYTREEKDETTGSPIFLKNVGDRVTLWFNLKQDINCLNGKDNLQINEDKNGYDQYFQTDKMNMRHGTLIIRYTDYEGVKHDPVIYTDYLAANARTGADTKVELFEEGDYEVALDYEIVDTSGINTYTDYRIFFTFSIRNGNCMVYPFDIVTGSELQDNAITENGFKLDMAKSRYLALNVSRTVIIEGTGGHNEDVRFNRPANDGDEYKDEGIYTFDVYNRYTQENTTKTIYVGTDPFLKAMSVTGLSVSELDEKLAEGYTIGSDGKLIDPPVVEEETVQETESASISEDNSSLPEDTLETVSDNALVSANNIVSDNSVSQENEDVLGNNITSVKLSNAGIFAGIAVAIIVIVACVVIIEKNKKKNKVNEVITSNTETNNENQEDKQ